jgi:hypothetical protein
VSAKIALHQISDEQLLDRDGGNARPHPIGTGGEVTSCHAPSIAMRGDLEKSGLAARRGRQDAGGEPASPSPVPAADRPCEAADCSGGFTRCMVGPQAHRQDTASVGVPSVGDPVASGAPNGIGRTGLVNRLIRARLLVTWPFFTRSENMP